MQEAGTENQGAVSKIRSKGSAEEKVKMTDLEREILPVSFTATQPCPFPRLPLLPGSPESRAHGDV